MPELFVFPVIRPSECVRLWKAEPAGGVSYHCITTVRLFYDPLCNQSCLFIPSDLCLSLSSMAIVQKSSGRCFILPVLYSLRRFLCSPQEWGQKNRLILLYCHCSCYGSDLPYPKDTCLNCCLKKGDDAFFGARKYPYRNGWMCCFGFHRARGTVPGAVFPSIGINFFLKLYELIKFYQTKKKEW